VKSVIFNEITDFLKVGFVFPLIRDFFRSSAIFSAHSVIFSAHPLFFPLIPGFFPLIFYEIQECVIQSILIDSDDFH
jgi:hypothetical protein